MEHINAKRFATYRNAIARMAALTALLTLSFLATLPEVSRGQCPTPPSGCTYNFVTVSTTMDGDPMGGADSADCLSAGACCITMNICYTCCDGGIYVALEGVQVENSSCTAYSPDQLMDWAMWYAEDYAIAQYDYPMSTSSCNVHNSVCPGFTQVSSFFQSCWEQTNAVGNATYTACTSEGCVCTITFDVCWDPVHQQIVTSNYNYSSTSPCDCPTEPVWPNPWTQNTCYLMACPDGKGGHQ